MSELKRPYFIEPHPPYSPHIGALVQMMEYVRSTTLEAVQDITAEELDSIPDGFSNSVGMLLWPTSRPRTGSIRPPASRIGTLSRLPTMRLTSGP